MHKNKEKDRNVRREKYENSLFDWLVVSNYNTGSE